MYIKEIVQQIRRDLWCIYECEHCKDTQRAEGYDDRNFHDNVVPKFTCKKCGKTADMKTYKPRKTKYPEGFQV